MIKFIKYSLNFSIYVIPILLLLLLLFVPGCSPEPAAEKNIKDEIVGVWIIDKENVIPKGTIPPQQTDLIKLVIRPDNTFTAYNVPAKFFFSDDPYYEKLCGSWGVRNIKDEYGYTYIYLKWDVQKEVTGTYGLTLGYKHSKGFLYSIRYSGYTLCFSRINKVANIGEVEPKPQVVNGDKK